MGSRIMHLIIANKVYEKLNISTQQPFLLGGIAPDAAFSRERKNISHFYEGDLSDETRFVNYHSFIDKYSSEIKSEFMLGYLTHLVADDVWIKFIYFKNNFKSRLDADPSLLERWHNDFRILNGRLIERYKCLDLKNNLIQCNPLKYNIDEINYSELEILINDSLNDFKYSKEELVKELQVYNISEVMDYIKLSIDSAVILCSAILNNGYRCSREFRIE
jgi:hypothetical protein